PPPISTLFPYTTLFRSALHHKMMKDKTDPISGEWNVLFTLQGTQVPGTFRLKLDGEKLTGTVESEHTGAGTVDKGTWADHQISRSEEHTSELQSLAYLV